MGEKVALEKKIGIDYTMSIKTIDILIAVLVGTYRCPPTLLHKKMWIV